jgi:hypothetical protein
MRAFITTWWWMNHHMEACTDGVQRTPRGHCMQLVCIRVEKVVSWTVPTTGGPYVNCITVRMKRRPENWLKFLHTALLLACP